VSLVSPTLHNWSIVASRSRMITRLWPLTLLVMQIVLGYDHEINLNRCKDETACFIRETCKKDKSNPGTTQTEKELFETNKKKLVHYTEGELKDEECDVVLQMKRLGQNRMHVMMRVKANTGEKLKEEDGLKLDQGENQFHCKSVTKIDGKLGYTLKYEGNPIFSKEEIFCSFTVETPDDVSLLNKNQRTQSDKPTIIVMKEGDVKEALNFDKPSNNLWHNLGVDTCEHSLISSSNKDDKEYILTEMNTFLMPPFTCPNGILIEKSDSKKSRVEVKKVLCDDSLEWKYEEEGKESTKLDNTFAIYCAEKICRKCDSPPAELPSCKEPCKPLKPPIIPPDPDCAQLSCPNNKWTTTGTSIIQGTAECRRSKADATKFAWFLKEKASDKETELTNAGCLDMLDCNDHLKNTTCTITNAKCEFEGKKAKSMSCEKGYKLQLDGKDSEKIDCNTMAGRLFDPKATRFDNSDFKCIAEPKKDAAGAAKAGFWNENQVPILVVGGGLLLMGLVGLGGFIACRMVRNKKNKKKA
ncbi:hypothetical protein PMAYCL1PPCAC_11403, partial [Pristionchus mayeri]